MAQHNPDARAFLLIVLGGIVIGFVIAGYVVGGHQSESGAKMHTETAAPNGDAKRHDAMPDEAPDAMTPEQTPELAVPESPPPAPSP